MRSMELLLSVQIIRSCSMEGVCRALLMAAISAMKLS